MADDNPGDVLILRETLNERNLAHQVYVQDDGEAAIRFIMECDGRTPSLDVFVIDMHMPKASGLEVVKSIRGRPCFAKQPIVLLSSVLSEREQRDVEIIPLCFFMKKPLLLNEWFDISDFIRALCDKTGATPIKAKAGGSQA